MQAKAERSTELAAARGYAAGDRVRITKENRWGQTGVVHWCNSEWANVRLDNGEAILSVSVKHLEPHIVADQRRESDERSLHPRCSTQRKDGA